MLSVASAALSFAPGVAMRPSVSTPAVTMGPGLSWSQPGEGKTWDPLNLATTPERFDRLRYVEVKHGRIAMLAVVGYAAEEYLLGTPVAVHSSGFFEPFWAHFFHV